MKFTVQNQNGGYVSPDLLLNASRLRKELDIGTSSLTGNLEADTNLKFYSGRPLELVGILAVGDIDWSVLGYFL